MWSHSQSPLAPPSVQEDQAKMIHASLPSLEIHGSIQFKLDKNAYRMIPLANSEDYLYNRGTLKRQREVRVCVFVITLFRVKFYLFCSL